jgi:hypothetical protein
MTNMTTADLYDVTGTTSLTTSPTLSQGFARNVTAHALFVLLQARGLYLGT